MRFIHLTRKNKCSQYLYTTLIMKSVAHVKGKQKIHLGLHYVSSRVYKAIFINIQNADPCIYIDTLV